MGDEGRRAAADRARRPGAAIAFTTRQGGVSDGSFASLNLGFATADDAASVAENRRRALRRGGRRPRRAREPAAAPRQRRASRRRRRAGALPRRRDRLARGRRARRPPSPACRSIAHGADCLTAALVAPGRRAWRSCTRAGAGSSRACSRRPPSASGRASRRPSGRAPAPAATRSATTSPAPLRARFGEDVVADGRADLAACAGRALERGGAATVVTRRPLHDLRRRALPLAPPRRRRQRPAGRDRVPREEGP